MKQKRKAANLIFVLALAAILLAWASGAQAGKQVAFTGAAPSGMLSGDSCSAPEAVNAVPAWQAVTASAPAWAGNGFPRDGCTATNASGQWVTYLIGDTNVTGIVGFWGYNHTTNTWFNPGATGTPADRWAPDWAYDADTNLCYLTGGASTPGGGTYAEAYVFDPVANSFTQLANFTSVRDFHNSWVGTIDDVKHLCIGGGNNGAGMTSTQCYNITGATWAAEDATIGPYPTDIWGAADGTLHGTNGDQFWTVAGVQTGSVSDGAYYWDDADNSWHSAGNTGAPRYRVEGDFFRGAFFQLGGSSGGFSPTSTVVRGHDNGTAWVWESLPDMANIRMDNIVAVTPSTIWSIDGYGSTASDYVEYLVGLCTDADGDGYGDNCTAGPDCNDNESAIHNPVTYYPDADSDGYRADNGTEFCLLTPPAGYLDNSSSVDADDTDPFYTDFLPSCEVKVIPKTLGWLIGDREKTRSLLVIGKRGTDFGETSAIKWESDAIEVVRSRVFFKRFMFMRAKFNGEPLDKQEEYRVLVGNCEGSIKWAR